MVMPRNACGANSKISAKHFFKNSPMKPNIKRVHDPVVRNKYWWLVTEGVWRCIEAEGQAPWHERLLGAEWVRLCTYMIVKNDRSDYRSYTLFMGITVSPVPQVLLLQSVT